MKLLTAFVAILTSLGIIVTSILKPSIKFKKISINFSWVIALSGALILFCTTCLSFKEFLDGVSSNNFINPLKILILFFSMTMISIFLDELGFFAKVASMVISHTKDSQFKIFVALYFLVAILTMFTSNDIIILTLTPFIIFFCKNAKISPIPYLISEFVCANTWSMMFIIGNPTNIYLAQSYNIDFVSYFLKMLIPTLCAGIIEFIILVIIFNKKLKEPISHVVEPLPPLNRFLTSYALSILIVSTIMLVISSYVSLPMYLIALFSFLILIIGVLIYAFIVKDKPKELGRSFLRGPYELIPFVLSMFAIVLALEKHEITSIISSFLGNQNTQLTYGYSSLLMSNLINNIPMSVLYSSLASNLSNQELINAVYASIIGSNIGAFLTPMGALAGLIWMNILKSHDIKYTFLDFIKYGLIIALPVGSIAIFALYL